ncbi:MAG: VOC family protein [Ornithinimicrobium sp.]
MDTSPALDIGISRDIYPMPSFVTVTVSDLDSSTAWYEAIGFINLFTMPGPGGSPALIHMRRWRYQDVLLVPGPKPTSPSTGFTLSLAAEAEELAGIAEAAATMEVGHAGTPAVTPWNAIELHLTDPDGYPLTFTARAPEQDRDETFERWMAEQA